MGLNQAVIYEANNSLVIPNCPLLTCNNQTWCWNLKDNKTTGSNRGLSQEMMYFTIFMGSTGTNNNKIFTIKILKNVSLLIWGCSGRK